MILMRHQIRSLVEQYAFVRYYYLYTVGHPWNRSHALNTGIRVSDASYILMGDVDLIYSTKCLFSD